MQTVSSSTAKDGFPCYVFAEPSILGNIPPRIVKNQDELKALGRGWQKHYSHQDFPRTMYHDSGTIKRVVHSKKKKMALGIDWSRTPPEGYVEPTSKTADDLKLEHEQLQKQMLELQNDEM